MERDSAGRFIKGMTPWNKGQLFSEETRAKMRLAHADMPEERRQRISISVSKAHQDGRLKSYYKGRALPLEVRNKISASRRGKPSWNKGKPWSKEHAQRISQLRRGKPPPNKGVPCSPETKAKISANIRALLQGIDVHWNKGRVRTLEQRQTTAELTRAMWQNPEYVVKQMNGRNTKPNKQELLLDSWLQKDMPGVWKYVGDGRDKEFILGGKCPDWGHANGQKKLIELFGDYWHRGEDPQEKVDHYKQYGFDTLVIWEHELSNPSEVLRKVKEFRG